MFNLCGIFYICIIYCTLQVKNGGGILQKISVLCILFAWGRINLIQIESDMTNKEKVSNFKYLSPDICQKILDSCFYRILFFNVLKRKMILKHNNGAITPPVDKHICFQYIQNNFRQLL